MTVCPNLQTHRPSHLPDVRSAVRAYEKYGA